MNSFWDFFWYLLPILTALAYLILRGRSMANRSGAISEAEFETLKARALA